MSHNNEEDDIMMNSKSNNDDTKGNNDYNDDSDYNDEGHHSSISSDDDSGITMTKELKQLINLQTQVSKKLMKIGSIRTKLNDNKMHEKEKLEFESLLVKINCTLAKYEKNENYDIKSELKQLRNENKQIKKQFNGNKKCWQASLKADKAKMKEEKAKLKQEKSQMKLEKQQKKLEKQKLKEIKKAEKEERKNKKLEFANKLEKARLDNLPFNENYESLTIWVDGWNISGCFGGRSRSKSKLINLLQDYYNNYQSSNNNNNNKCVLNNIELFYDGNGKNKLDNNVNITHSGKEQIVDDLWIELLSHKISNKEDTSNIICVTSDRELTVRLYNIDIKVMKSGTFFKTYLKPLMPEKQENHNNKNNNNNQNDDIKMD